MTPRLQIAAQIFPGLILHDLDHAIKKPQEVAHRALLFADALLVCDQQVGPCESGAPGRLDAYDGPRGEPLADFTSRIATRRSSPSVH